MKGTYTFTFEITGTCSVTIEANSPEEAVKKVQDGEGAVELDEWDKCSPYGWDHMDTTQAMKNCSDKPKKKGT